MLKGFRETSEIFDTKRKDNMKCFAHTKEGKPQEKWQELEQHLVNVAELARKYASKFRAGDCTYMA